MSREKIRTILIQYENSCRELASCEPDDILVEKLVDDFIAINLD